MQAVKAGYCRVPSLTVSRRAREGRADRGAAENDSPPPAGPSRLGALRLLRAQTSRGVKKRWSTAGLRIRADAMNSLNTSFAFVGNYSLALLRTQDHTGPDYAALGRHRHLISENMPFLLLLVFSACATGGRRSLLARHKTPRAVRRTRIFPLCRTKRRRFARAVL